eukprot:scaffold714_cov121-Isochrysis_galbana.AAC.22
MRGEGRATVAWRQLCARSTGHRAAAAAAARLLELLRVLPFPRGDRGLAVCPPRVPRHAHARWTPAARRAAPVSAPAPPRLAAWLPQPPPPARGRAMTGQTRAAPWPAPSLAWPARAPSPASRPPAERAVPSSYLQAPFELQARPRAERGRTQATLRLAWPASARPTRPAGAPHQRGSAAPRAVPRWRPRAALASQ